MQSKDNIKQVQRIIKQLECGKKNVNDVPKKYALNSDIIHAERELGLRVICQRGFDVIRQEFFVEEEIVYKCLSLENKSEIIKTTFNSFEEYYNYLEGNIYENACYFQYKFQDNLVKSLKLDVNKLSEKKHFVTETIDDYTLVLSQEEMNEYKQGEKVKCLCKKWIKKFNSCKNYEELESVCEKYSKSKLAKDVNISFFLWQYIFTNINKKNNLRVIMQYMSKQNYIGMVKGLCSIYNPEDVLVLYDYSVGSKENIYKVKKKIKDYVQAIYNGDIESKTKAYFDEETHFFCEEINLFEYKNIGGLRKKTYAADICRYFESFEIFIEYRKGNLSNCDLSGAIDLNVDFSNYIIDEESTKLPLTINKNFEYEVFKYFENNKFIVDQYWINKGGNILKDYTHQFDYFFDFVAFLKGDLSNSDMLFCDGLANLESSNGINFENASMRSSLKEKLNMPYKTLEYKKDLIVSFPVVQKNERKKNTQMIVLDNEDEKTLSALKKKFFYDYEFNGELVYYITDLHLMHRIQNAGCKSEDDMIYVIQNIINSFVKYIGMGIQSENLLLIGGDTASEFYVFKLFVEKLKQSLDSCWKTKKTRVVFILGNHELWDVPELSLDQTVEKYRELINENGMYLLQNELLYKNESNDICVISYKDLCGLNEETLENQLRCSRIVILGGIAFSGYNKKFNANNGVYKEIIDRDEEILETIKFENLYNKLRKILKLKNTIILTHMPMEDWYKGITYEGDFTYVSGHTHRNCNYNNGEKRIYADNQIGYRNNNPYLKCFYISNEYDYFYDYKDGLYEISRQEYNDFYRGKNIQMNYTRETYILYMLKKKGYYCFIRKSGSDGSLSILNGGALKKLKNKDIKYYYDNMDKVVSFIETPLDKYTRVQEQIADEIKRIGGEGYIHGSIIDIDYYNHVYINPYDWTITGYWASDIKNKLVYPNIPALLKEQCPDLYKNYMKMIEGSTSDSFVISNIKEDISSPPQPYLDTDIYKVSREIKKMQKTRSNILCTWYDNFLEDIALPKKQ